MSIQQDERIEEIRKCHPIILITHCEQDEKSRD
jgi:hypothetical protein